MGREGSPRSSRSRLGLTESQEDYLKQIFLLGEGGAVVSTQSLAERLEVRPASVTGMVRRLVGLGLVDHTRYRGVRLTESGRRVALQMLRHHRLVETFLARELGYGWEQVHEEAERLEHVISEHLEARMAETLGNPTRDPHGDPIPDANLSMPGASVGVRLTDLAAGEIGHLTRVSVQDSGSLRLLARLGLVPGAVVEARGAVGSAVGVSVDGERHLVPAELAREIWMEESCA